MILKIYSTYDSKAKAYMAPFYMPQDGQATRLFSQAVNDKTHSYGKAPADYTIFKVGEFDDNTAEFTTHAPQTLGNGIEFLETTEHKTNDPRIEPIQPSTTS